MQITKPPSLPVLELSLVTYAFVMMTKSECELFKRGFL